MNKQVYVFLMGFLLLFSLVSGLSIDADIDSNVIVKEFGNSVYLDLGITDAETGYYNVYTFADVTISPSEFIWNEESDFDINLVITPLDRLDVEGNYIITCILNQRDVEKFESRLVLKIVPLEDLLEIETNYINLEDGKVEVFVKNLENVELKNLTARFDSILFDFEETFDIGANELVKLDVDVDVDLLKKIKAGTYVIDVRFDTPKGERSLLGKLYLNEKKGIITQEDKSGFFIRTLTVNKINSGNVLENVEVRIKKNILTRLFTSFNVEPAVIDRKGFSVYYTWNKNIGPADVFTVKANTNYLYPILIVLVLYFVWIGIKRFVENKIDVKKMVSPIKTKNDEFALRVRLSVKAKRDMKNVTLVDKVPSAVKIYKKFGLNKPDDIDAVTRRLKWYVGDLAKGEERMYSYVVYSKVGYVGKFSLPAATLLFEENEKIHEVESNNVFFMSDQGRKN